MPYHLLFCLASEDTGSVANPALTPLVGPDGNSQIFFVLEEAHRVLNRLRRLSDGLVYYIRATSVVAEFGRMQQQRAGSGTGL